MNDNMSLLSDLRVLKSSKFSIEGDNDYPESPYLGQIATVGGMPLMYSNINGIETWFPLTSKKENYIHIQSEKKLEWIVTHNFQTYDFIYFAYNENNQIMYASVTVLDANSFRLNFTEEVKGKVVVFVNSELFVASMNTNAFNASEITVGETIVINETGIYVSGKMIPPDIVQQVEDAVSSAIAMAVALGGD